MSKFESMHVDNILGLINNFDADSDVVDWVASNINRVIRDLSDANEHISQFSLERRIKYSVERAATHINISEACLLQMYNDLKKARHNDLAIDSMFVKNNKCCHELLDMLADSLEWGVRGSVAKHKNVSPHTLLRLSAEQSLRDSITKNVNCDSAILERLASDDNIVVSLNVCKHPNTPLHARIMTAKCVKHLVDEMLATMKEPEWEECVADGQFNLRMMVDTLSGPMEFGDYLIKNNIIDYFELIQSIELKLKVKEISNNPVNVFIVTNRKSMFRV